MIRQARAVLDGIGNCWNYDFTTKRKLSLEKWHNLEKNLIINFWILRISLEENKYIKDNAQNVKLSKIAEGCYSQPWQMLTPKCSQEYKKYFRSTKSSLCIESSKHLNMLNFEKTAITVASASGGVNIKQFKLLIFREIS